MPAPLIQGLAAAAEAALAVAGTVAHAAVAVTRGVRCLLDALGRLP